MKIVMGKMLRKLIPDGILETEQDPIAKEKTNSMNPPDLPGDIWSAELTTAGRGRGKKNGIALMSANSGFVLVAPLPAPSFSSDEPSEEELGAYREELSDAVLSGMVSAFGTFGFPEEKARAYAQGPVAFYRGKSSTPSVRLEVYIKNNMIWEMGDDPALRFDVVRGNLDSRKFGNSPFYRPVAEAAAGMLGLNDSEREEWLRSLAARKENAGN